MIKAIIKNQEMVFSFNRIIRSDEPPLQINLPFNVDTLLFRFLTNSERMPKLFVTNDIDEWFSYPINYSDLGGYKTPVAIVDHSLFPTCSEQIDRGEFVLQFSCNRKD